MTILSIPLGVAASGFALAAACYWLKASKVEAVLGWVTEPGDPRLTTASILISP